MLLKSYRLTMRHPDLPPSMGHCSGISKEEECHLHEKRSSRVSVGEARSRRALGNTARQSPVSETEQGSVPCQKSQDGRGHAGEGQNQAVQQPHLSVMKGASQRGTEYCLEFVNPSRADSVWEARKYFKNTKLCFSTLLEFSFYTLTLLQMWLLHHWLPSPTHGK